MLGFPFLLGTPSSFPILPVAPGVFSFPSVGRMRLLQAGGPRLQEAGPACYCRQSWLVAWQQGTSGLKPLGQIAPLEV